MNDQTPAATSPKARALLGSEDVNKWHCAAMRALGDNEARRKWSDSKPGGPVTVMLLCEDVSRLQIERAEMLAALEAVQKLHVYAGDDAMGFADRVDRQVAEVIAKAYGRSMPSPKGTKS